MMPPGLPGVAYPTASNHTPQDNLQWLDEQNGTRFYQYPHTQNQMDDGSGYASMDLAYGDQYQAVYAYNRIDYSNTDPQLYYAQSHSSTSLSHYHSGGYTQSQSPALNFRTPQFSAVPSPSRYLFVSPQQYRPQSAYPQQQQQEWYTNSLIPVDNPACTHDVPNLEGFAVREPGAVAETYYCPQSQSPDESAPMRSPHCNQSLYDPAHTTVPSSTAPLAAVGDTGEIFSYFATEVQDIQGHSHYVDHGHTHSGTSLSMQTQPSTQIYTSAANMEPINMGTTTTTTTSGPITLSSSSELSGALDESAIRSGGGRGRVPVPGPALGRGKVPEVGRSGAMTTSSAVASASAGTTLSTTLPLDGPSTGSVSFSTTSMSQPKPKPTKEGQLRKKSKSKSKIWKRSPTPVMDFLQPPDWEREGGLDGSDEEGSEEEREDGDEDDEGGSAGDGEVSSAEGSGAEGHGRTRRDDSVSSGRSSANESSLPPRAPASQSAFDSACIASLVPTASPTTTTTPATVQTQTQIPLPCMYYNHNHPVSHTPPHPHPNPPQPPNPLMEILVSQLASLRQQSPQQAQQQTVQQTNQPEKKTQLPEGEEKKQSPQFLYPHAQVAPPPPGLLRPRVCGPLPVVPSSSPTVKAAPVSAEVSATTGPVYLPLLPPPFPSSLKPAPVPPLTSTSTLITSTSMGANKHNKSSLKSRPISASASASSLTSASIPPTDRNALPSGSGSGNGSGGGMLFVQDEAAFRPTKPKPLPKAQREKERELERTKGRAKELAVNIPSGSRSSGISPATATAHGRGGSQSRAGGSTGTGSGAGGGAGRGIDAPWTMTPLPVSLSVTTVSSASQSRMHTPTATVPSQHPFSSTPTSIPMAGAASSYPRSDQNPYPQTHPQTQPCIPPPPPPPAPYHPGSARYITPVSRLKPPKRAPQAPSQRAAQAQAQGRAEDYHDKGGGAGPSMSEGGINVDGSGSGATGACTDTGPGRGTGAEVAGPAGRAKQKAKPALACLFCRMRKIACVPPVPGSGDMACNQCERRSRKCEYPAESRRGQHKRKEHSYSTGTPVMPPSLGVSMSTSKMSMSVGVTGDGGARTMAMEGIKMEGCVEGMSGIDRGSVEPRREGEATDVDGDVNMQDEMGKMEGRESGLRRRE